MTEERATTPIRLLIPALLAVAFLAAGCGDPSISKEERKAVGSQDLDTKAAVVERYGEPLEIEGLSGYEKRCIYYKSEDPPFDGAAYELCFDNNDEFDSGMTVATEEIMRPGPVVPVP